jgi:hypothetical protein
VAYTPGTSVGVKCNNKYSDTRKESRLPHRVQDVNGTSYVTLASWNVVAQPVGPTLLLKTPNLATICTGHSSECNIQCRQWWYRMQ